MFDQFFSLLFYFMEYTVCASRVLAHCSSTGCTRPSCAWCSGSPSELCKCECHESGDNDEDLEGDASMILMLLLSANMDRRTVHAQHPERGWQNFMCGMVDAHMWHPMRTAREQTEGRSKCHHPRIPWLEVQESVVQCVQGKVKQCQDAP